MKWLKPCIFVVSFILLFSLLLKSWLPLALIYTFICGVALLYIFRVEDWPIIRFVSASLISGIIIISVAWAIFSVALKTYNPLHSPLIYILAGVVLLALIILAYKYGSTPVIEKLATSDIVVTAVILIAGLCLTQGSWAGDVYYSKLVSTDSATEFMLIERAYLLGYWEPFQTSLLSSALSTTVFPAWAAQFSRHNDIVIVMSAMPSLVVVLFLLAGYAFATQYLTTFYALIYLLIISSSRHIMIDPGAYLRLILAVACMMVLLNCFHRKEGRRLYYLVAFLTVGLIVTHYGTAMLYLALAGIAILLHNERRLIAVSVGTVLALAVLWYGVVQAGALSDPSTLHYISMFIKNSIVSFSGYDGSTEPIANYWVFKDWHLLYKYAATNILVGWGLQLGIICAIVYSLIKDRVGIVYFAASGFILFLITIAMPFIPQWYGLMRVLFTVNTIGVIAMLRPCSSSKSLPLPIIISVLTIIYSIYAIPL